MLSNAGGRFALSGSNLVIASPQLFTADPDATYDVVVRVAQPNGVAIDHKITLHHDDVIGRAPIATEHAPAERGGETAGVKPVMPSGPQGNAVADAEAASGGDDKVVDVRGDAHPDAQISPTTLKAVPAHSLRFTWTRPGRRAPRASPISLPLALRVARPRRMCCRKCLPSSSGTPPAATGRARGPSADKSGRDDDHISKYEKDLADALRHFRSGDDDRGDRGDRGSDHRSELQKAQDAVSGDTLLFKPGFGKETIEHVKLSGGEAHDVLDLSLYGTTFEALRAAGAFEQVGNDVVLTLNPADPAHSDQIILKSIDLHQIDAGDFKFS